MSDTRDSIAEAARLNRLLIAKTQVREDALDEEMKALRAERAALAESQSELRQVLGEKLTELDAEKSALKSEREAAMAELGELRKLAGNASVIEAQGLAREALAFTGVDPDDVDENAVTAPRARLTEEEARAQLAAMKAARGGTGNAARTMDTAPTGDDAEAPAKSPDADGRPSLKRTL